MKETEASETPPDGMSACDWAVQKEMMRQELLSRVRREHKIARNIEAWMTAPPPS